MHTPNAFISDTKAISVPSTVVDSYIFCQNAESNVEKIFIKYDESCLAMTLP